MIRTTTAERLLFYWQGELNRLYKEYVNSPEGSEERETLKKQYELAKRTYKELMARR